MKPTLVTVAWISLTTLLCGCSSGIISARDGNPTMEQTYNVAKDEQTSFSPSDNAQIESTARVIGNNAALPSATVVQSPGQITSTLDSQFPTVPNPQSVMYIFGHYAGDEQLPVPGHFTAFALYTQTHYALPDEIQRPYNDGQFGVDHD